MHNIFVSREGIARDVYKGLETIWFMHRQLWQNFPVQLDVLLHQSMHKVTIVNLKPENDIKQTEIIESQNPIQII